MSAFWWCVTGPCAAIVGYVLGRVFRALKKEHDVALKHLQHAHCKQMFNIANEERETLEKFVKNNPFKASPRRRGESPWAYTRRLADEGCFGSIVKPWELSWGGHILRSDGSTPWDSMVFVKTSIRCWTTLKDGLRHRVGKLTMTDGTVADTLLCDPSCFVETPIMVHDINHIPVITCLGCVVKEG
jgi:hypothetical protein